jgi:hypothetical protein
MDRRKEQVSAILGTPDVFTDITPSPSDGASAPKIHGTLFQWNGPLLTDSQYMPPRRSNTPGLEVRSDESIPPLFLGEILIPKDLQEYLVQSTTAILKRFVRWNPNATNPDTGQMGVFERRPDQPDLVLLPLRSAPIAASGLIALAEKHHLPIPTMLPVEGFGSEVYSAYERAHCHFENLFKTDREEFERQERIDVGSHGAEESFLEWIRLVTSSLHPDDRFQFSDIDFRDPYYGTEDEIVGGFRRFLSYQIEPGSPPNPIRDSVGKIESVGTLQHDHDAERKTHIMVIDDVTQSQTVNGVIIPRIISAAFGDNIIFKPAESKFIFPKGRAWYEDIVFLSSPGIDLDDLEYTLVDALLRGAYCLTGGNDNIMSVPYENIPFESPSDVEACSCRLSEKTDVIDSLKNKCGLVHITRQNFISRIINLNITLKKALIEIVNRSEEHILNGMKTDV